LDNEPLNIDNTDEEKNEQKKLRKIYLILSIYFLGSSIPFIGFAVLANYVVTNMTLFADGVFPLVMSSFAFFIVLFFIGLFSINRICHLKYGHGIIEASPFYRPPAEEPTKEDDQIDVSLLREKHFKKNLQRDLIITIIFSLLFVSIGIVFYFMGLNSSTSYKWVGYLLLGFFTFFSISVLIVGIVRYFKSLKESKVNIDTKPN